MAATDALMRTLDEEISTKDLPRSCWELLDYLTAKLKESGKDLPIYVDVNALPKEVREVIDGQLPPPLRKLQPLPARLSVRSILQLMLKDFAGEATLLIRQHRVEITSKTAASLPELLKQTVIVAFDREPLEHSLDALSEISGVSVVIDSRARDKLRSPVTARFRNDVPLLDALRLLAEAAELKLVEIWDESGTPQALFVTTPERAQTMQRKADH
jgi:hypothetical protein